MVLAKGIDWISGILLCTLSGQIQNSVSNLAGYPYIGEDIRYTAETKFSFPPEQMTFY